ncbi:MAG: T9SS type A sorting domain-containing protein [Bacteroidetes bacterium]|nr:T9SS type A sorting domain-containing protein [Bacteroidota bacterium]
MKQKFIFLSVFCCVSYQLNAQLSENRDVIINDIQAPKIQFYQHAGTGKSGSCGEDTLYYPYYKSTGFYAISLNSSTSASAFTQYYPAPQSVKISGFDFFAYQSSGGSTVVTITCNLYLAGSDSLPLGSPIRSATIQIDTTFGRGYLSDLRKHISFSNPPTLSVPYIVSIETSSGTSVSVICNNYSNGDGRSEWLSGAKLNGSWIKSNQVNVGGVPLNADFILMPTVSYSITSDFFFTGCNEGTASIQFTNNSSSIIQHKFYNRYAYYGIPQYSTQWNFGDTSGIVYAVNASHQFKHRMPYIVTLRDTMYGWTIGCVDYNSKEVPFRPLPPGVSNSSPVCSGDSIQLFADTVTGLSYSWIGPDSFSSSDQNPKLYQSDTSMIGPYYLRVSYKNCQSDDTSTQLLIHQTPQKPVATNDGPKCVGDSVVFSASTPSPGITYRWSGPNGFSDSSDGFVFYSLDTTDAGDYTVFVQDGFCTSDTDTTTLRTYPPPQIPSLKSMVGDSLCQGDTLFLQGLSVTGALFDWNGPNGFQSDTAFPVIAAKDTLQSGWYSGRVIIGSCISGSDSIHIQVLRTPVTSAINGSDTSTEFFTKTYQSPKDYRDGLVWTCIGGHILQMDSLNGDVLVKWDTNGTGLLIVNAFTPNGCYGFSERKKVEILPAPVDHTGIDPFHFGMLKVYPNPGAQFIRILNPNNLLLGTYELRNLQGQLLASGDAKKVISIETLPNGIYHLIIQSSAGPQIMPVQVLH